MAMRTLIRDYKIQLNLGEVETVNIVQVGRRRRRIFDGYSMKFVYFSSTQPINEILL